MCNSGPGIASRPTSQRAGGTLPAGRKQETATEPPAQGRPLQRKLFTATAPARRSPGRPPVAVRVAGRERVQGLQRTTPPMRRGAYEQSKTCNSEQWRVGHAPILAHASRLARRPVPWCAALFSIPFLRGLVGLGVWQRVGTCARISDGMTLMN